MSSAASAAQELPEVLPDGGVRHPPPPPPPPRKIAADENAGDQELEALSSLMTNFNWSGDAVESCAKAIMDPKGPAAAKLKGVVQLKQLLCTSRENVFRIAQDVIDSGVLRGLVYFISSECPYPELKLPAAFCLTNIAAGHDDQTAAVVQAGAIPPCLELLRSREEYLRRQAIFCLANIAGSTPEFRRVLASHAQYFTSITFAVLHAKDPKVEELAGWNIRNMCILGGPDFESIKPGLEFFAEQLHRNLPRPAECRTTLTGGTATLGAVLAGPHVPAWSRHSGLAPFAGLGHNVGSSAAVLRFACETFSFISRDFDGRLEILSLELPLPLLFHAKFNSHHAVRNHALECIANLMHYGPIEARVLTDKAGAVIALSELLADHISYTPQQRILAARSLCWLAAEGYTAHANAMVEHCIITREFARRIIQETRERAAQRAQKEALLPSDADGELGNGDDPLGSDPDLVWPSIAGVGASTLEIAYGIFAQTERPEEFLLREKCGRLIVAILAKASDSLLWETFTLELFRLVLDVLDVAIHVDVQQLMTGDSTENTPTTSASMAQCEQQHALQQPDSDRCVPSASFVAAVLKLMDRLFQMGEELKRRDAALDNPVAVMLAQLDGMHRLEAAISRVPLPFDVVQQTVFMIQTYCTP